MSNIRSYKGVTPQLGNNTFIDRSASVIGDVTLGDDSSIWPQAVVRGDMHGIRIGARTSVQDGSVLHITHASEFNPGGYPLIIGNDVTIGHLAMLHGCTIGHRVLIGMKAMVMDGATIEDEVIVAAGAVVPPGKVLTGGYVYRGSPAQQVRPVSDKERHFFTYSAANYVRLKNQYLQEGIHD